MADSQSETPKSSRQTQGADSNERDSPRRDERRRSRSPRSERRGDRPRRKDGGFKWKEKRRDDDRPQDRDHGSQRGHRDHYRPRSRSRSPRRRSPRRDDRSDRDRDDAKVSEDKQRKEKKEKAEKKKAPPAPQQPMIIVTVNDRLGTKKAIPCFATDSVSKCSPHAPIRHLETLTHTSEDFKIIVASMIGRQPHEILLKRQGERPFKDQLTLQDYGVSNNVQLDLEVDTGD
jgi:hypothetical protein